jgi:hypothetical protein
MHVNNRVPKISSIISSVPEQLDDLIYRATSANPDERPRDATVFYEKLSRISHSLNPQENQLSLELDIPIEPMRPKPSRKSLRSKVKGTHRSDSCSFHPITSRNNGRGEKAKESEQESTSQSKDCSCIGGRSWHRWLVCSYWSWFTGSCAFNCRCYTS